jgi:hypothetical protein
VRCDVFGAVNSQAIIVIGLVGLWPRSNKNFVPSLEPRISIYVEHNPALARSPGWGAFSHPEAAVRKCLRLFCGGFLKMIVEVTTVLFLIQGVRVVSRLIETRRDVFYYVEARQRTYV